MNYEFYDESQGLTLQAFKLYLARRGWCSFPDEERFLLKPQMASLSLTMGLGTALQRLARVENKSMQVLLRDINPRMRQGVPSEAAIHAHLDEYGGNWLASSTMPNYAGQLRVGHWTNKRDFCAPDFACTQLLYHHDIPASWCFWPCDAHGNKVRWPEREGVML